MAGADHSLKRLSIRNVLCTSQELLNRLIGGNRDAVVGDGLADERLRIRHGAVILGCESWASQRTVQTRHNGQQHFTGEELQVKFSGEFS